MFKGHLAMSWLALYWPWAVVWPSLVYGKISGHRKTKAELNLKHEANLKLQKNGFTFSTLHLGWSSVISWLVISVEHSVSYFVRQTFLLPLMQLELWTIPGGFGLTSMTTLFKLEASVTSLFKFEALMTSFFEFEAFVTSLCWLAVFSSSSFAWNNFYCKVFNVLKIPNCERGVITNVKNINNNCLFS